jgi:hypothetical protein
MEEGFEILGGESENKLFRRVNFSSHEEENRLGHRRLYG